MRPVASAAAARSAGKGGAVCGVLETLEDNSPFVAWALDRLGHFTSVLEPSALTRGRVVQYAILEQLKNEYGVTSAEPRLNPWTPRSHRPSGQGSLPYAVGGAHGGQGRVATSRRSAALAGGPHVGFPPGRPWTPLSPMIRQASALLTAQPRARRRVAASAAGP